MKTKICIKCNKEFLVNTKVNGKRIKCGKRTSCYDCVAYVSLSDKIKNAQSGTYNCSSCNKEVNRRLKEISPSGLVYCSSSCAAKINNKNFKKRTFTNKCGHDGCETYISTGASYCTKCFIKIRKIKDINENTLGLYYLKGKGSNKNSGIRDHSRKVYRKSGEPKCCYVCGYSIYIEICHIKSIASFPMETLIQDVNDIKNLVALCPNHHKELDKGLIKLEKYHCLKS